MDPASDPSRAVAAPDAQLCQLYHPMFARMGDILFRRAESDATPVMVIALGDRQAALPLRSLQREFQIGDDTPDGRMLGLIAESLDYVPGLRLGDPLPAEVLSGEASWEPAEIYRQRARGRLWLQLLDWIAPGQVAAATPDTIGARLEHDPILQVLTQRAVDRVAVELGLCRNDAAGDDVAGNDASGSAAVTALIDGLSHELSFIEALRHSLLNRMQAVQGQLLALGQSQRGGVARLEALNQTTRLCETAVTQTQTRLEEIDAQTGEAIAALRNQDSQRAFIRSNRDTLYRTQRAWEPILLAWEAYASQTGHRPQSGGDDVIWRLVAQSYQFLAPRYMSFTEWQSVFTSRAARGGGKLANAMTW